MLQRSGLAAAIGEERVFPTLAAGRAAYEARQRA
jgi:hypothetical protein